MELWIVCLTALLLWIPQNAAHEGAHCVAHKLAGDTLIEFWPFPGWRSGSFEFAYMRYRKRVPPIKPFAEGLCASAPQMLNTLVLLLLLPLHGLSHPTWWIAILIGWGVVNLVDGSVNLATFYRPKPKPSTDGWRTAEAWGLHPWACRVFALVWHLSMGLHLFFLLRGLQIRL